MRSGDITDAAQIVLAPAADWPAPAGDLAWTYRWRGGRRATSLIDIGINCPMMMTNLANLDRRGIDGVATGGSEEQVQ